ncbi:MAG: DUF5989 family protein [Phycisphaerae bacterium]|jgi:hypothetical protein
MTEQENRSDAEKQFAAQAEQEDMGLFREFYDFLRHNRKWWMIPILAMLVLMGVVILLISNPVTAPFIYTLF